MRRLRKLIEKELSSLVKEKHDLSGAPEAFEVPEVNPNAQKFKEPNNKWHDVGDTTLDTGLAHEKYEADNSTKTATAVVLMDVEKAKELPGEMGENRHWHKRRGEWWFGMYPIEKWQKFVNDIAENGLDYEITVSVEKNGEVTLYEGNHRLAVYDLLGIPKIPVEIWWWGNVQGTERDPMKKYFKKAFNK